MKNIHVLSTDKQSRLWVNNLRRRLELDEFYSKHQTNIAKNIYITNDEEIKEGDYMYDIDGDVGKAIGSDMKEFEGNKIIILTTDLDLINDGVQAIDDEFLKWFVKNPSCERVEIKKQYITPLGDVVDFCYDNERLNYKIIIPKEEPDYTALLKPVGTWQETLEEAYEKFMNKNFSGQLTMGFVLGAMKFGAKWQQKRSYSEEEAGQLVYNIIGEYAKEYGITIDGAKLNDLFNQLKKQ